MNPADDVYLYDQIKTLTLSNTTGTVIGVKGKAIPVIGRGGP
jgi:hypothetical protein